MLADIVSRLRSLWRGVRRGADLDADMAEEFRLHIDLRAADLVRAGLTPERSCR